MDIIIIILIICCCCCCIISGGGGYYYITTQSVNKPSNNKTSAPTSNNKTSEPTSNNKTSESTSNNNTQIPTTTSIPTTTPIPMLYPFKTHTFTTANKSGPIGPTLNEVKNAYSSASWTQNSDFLNMTVQGIQEWKVPATGSYTIKAVGAKGGNALDGNTGGKGIDISTTTTLNKGEIIKILVGQMGADEILKPRADHPFNSPIGGGGGTFVIRDTQTPIIVAGGGGGATSSMHFSEYNGAKVGLNAVATTDGSGGGNSSHTGASAKAGVDGNGATMTGYSSGGGFGGQGGGLLSNGTDFGYEPSGKGFINGGNGGSNFGGFGGGACGYNNGGISSHGSGGGGGYSGGAGAIYSAQNPKSFYSAGGGGSYAISTITENGFNNSNGFVVITTNF
jgi:hypothetical protein